MVLKSINKIIEEKQKQFASIPLEKQHRITKHLLVGYDIEGRSYSDDLVHKSHDGKSEYDVAKARYDSQVRNNVITKDDMRRKMSNSTRNWIREKLIDQFGAMYLSDSLYLVPLQVIRDDNGQSMELSEAEEFLEAWGKTNGVNIQTLANEFATERTISNVSKSYYLVLQERFKEMDQDLDNALEKIQDLQDQIAVDPQKTIRGVHRIVESIEKRTNEAQDLINRYGDPKKDQFKLTKIIATTRLISEIYDRIKDMKEASKK